MEHPDYNKHIYMCPSEDVRLAYTREYLDRAKLALTETGKMYRPSKAELSAGEFDKNIPNIKLLKLSIGGFYPGRNIYTVFLSDRTVHYEAEECFIPVHIPSDDSISKDDFLEAVRDLHLGEWRKLL